MKKFFLLMFLVPFILIDLHAQKSDLFFSSYLEGSSNNKALEIYNGTGSNVDLSLYRVVRANNGSAVLQDSLPLAGTLDDGGVFVIANPQADPILLAVANVDTGTITFYNGDDYMALQKDISGVWTTIDVIGVLGVDPGTAWDVAGVTNATGEHTLIRKTSVTGPTTDWAVSAGTDSLSSEWLVYPQNTFKYMGYYGSSINVTFRANMSVQILKGLFTIGVDTVEVRGSFQKAAGDTVDWAGFYFTMTKGATDSIYSATATFPFLQIGNAYEYKIVINDGGWESSPNRPFTVPAKDTVLPVVFYGDENVFVVAVKNIVLFQADMSSYLGTAPGQFDPSQDSLVVMGLSNWGGYAVTSVEGNRTMAPSISDPTIYQALLTFYGPVGDSTAWKLKAYPDERFGNGGGYELGDNRWYYFVADTINPNVLAPVVPSLVIFAGDLANSVDVLFQVNMSNAVDFHSGATIPANTIDFVGLKGSIKPLGNWGGTWTFQDTVDAPTYVDTISTMKPMNDQGLNGDKVAGDNVWSRTVTFPAGTPAGTTEFKFGMGYPGVENENSGSSYLDNEMGFGINHNFFLTDGPAVELLFNFGVKDPVTGVVKENNTIPTVYSLNQNYPNPFNPSTTISYAIPATQLVTLKIYNLLGQEVVTLVNQEQIAGNYTVKLDASQFASGIYFYSLKAGNFTSTKKMMLMK
jgi:hypothetical protein